jgi:iron-sulfur cluster repair protein YtfE (RIC family)
MTETTLIRRPPGEPAPELTDYRVVHRAMTVDLHRLATAAAELVEHPHPARMAALRHYLRAVSSEIASHHHVEDEHVWPFLAAVAGAHTALSALTDDHDQLDPLLHRAAVLAARREATPELVVVLREISDLLVQHIAAEERDVFPLITAFVRVDDYQQLQRHFQVDLSLSLMPFLLPWAFRHASEQERAVLLARAGWPARALLRIFEPRFLAREELLFG